MSASVVEEVDITICLFCWTGERGILEGDNSEVFGRFLKVVGSYVGGKFGKEGLWVEDGEGAHVGACTKCGEILHRFCELYREMVRIQLEMDWRLGNLIGRMDRGGRIPARMRTVKEVLEQRFPRGGGSRGNRMLQNVKAVRTEILQKCNDKLSKSKPKVILDRNIAASSDMDIHDEALPTSTQLGNEDGRYRRIEPSQPRNQDSDEDMENIDFDNDFMGGMDDNYDDPEVEYSNEQKFCPSDEHPEAIGYQDDIDEPTESTPEEESNQKVVSSLASLLTCTICSQQFTFKSNLTRHVITKHPESSTSSRSSQRARTATRTNYVEESDSADEEIEKKIVTTRNTSSESTYACIFCPKEFSRKWKNNVIRHLRDNHSLSLSEAKHVFQSKIENTGSDDVNEEVQSISQGISEGTATDNPFKCTECLDSFKYRASLNFHLKKHHRITTSADATFDPSPKTRVYTCRFCQRNFSFKQNLNRHVKISHLRKLAKATSSESESSTEEEDFEKEYVETEDGTEKKCIFRCPHCRTGFSYKMTLRKHLKKFHSGVNNGSPALNADNTTAGAGDDNSLVCAICSAPFKRARNLDFHMRMYHQPGGGQGARMRVGSVGKYRCAYCQRGFSFKQNLNRHVNNRHRKRVPAKQGRPLKIIDRSSVIDIDSDNNEPLESLDVNDDAQFSSSETVENTAGLGEKDYKYACKLCPNRYTLKQNLNRHYNLSHSNREKNSDSESETDGEGEEKVKNTKRRPARHYVFKCAPCSRIFGLKQNLIRHMRYVHSMSLETANSTFESQKKELKISKDDAAELACHIEPAAKQFPCHYCPVKFTTVVAARRHILRFHSTANSTDNGSDDAEADTGSKIVSCPICSTSYKSQGILESHMRIYHNQEPKRRGRGRQVVERRVPTLPCPLIGCPEKFEVNDDLEKHQQFHGSFQCNFCTIVKEYAPHLSAHELEEHSGKPDEEIEAGTSTGTENKKDPRYNCARCDYSSEVRSSYISHHLESHLGFTKTMDILSCDICRIRPRQVDTNLHFITHHCTAGVDPSTIRRCNHCPAYFLKTLQLFHHKLNIHGIDERKTCPECGKIFSLYKNMKTHMRMVHKFDDENPDLPVPCQIPECRKRFATNEDLDWHMRFVRHVRNKDMTPMNCPECNKMCVGPEGLRIHMRSHGKLESEFICEQCGVGFKTNRGLQIHYEFHKKPEDWSFMCQECGKKFATEFILKRHMKTHTGMDRPHSCKFCGRSFAEQHQLKYHLSHVHKDKGDWKVEEEELFS